MGQRRLPRLIDLRAGEGPSVLLTFLLVATVVASFVLARTIRNGLFLSQFDAHSLVYVYVAVPLLLLAFTPFHTSMAGRSGQRAAITLTLLFFMTNVVVFWLLFRFHPWPALSGLFYIWVNCYGIIVSFQAWSFAASVFDTRQAKRLFGLIGSGAPAGAVVGGLLARILVRPMGGAQNLLLVLAALVGLAALLVTLTLRVIPRRPPRPLERRGRHILQETLRQVSRASYLRGIGSLVFLVAIVTQWTQFQFLLVAQERFARDADRLTGFLGEWNVYFGIVAFLVQVLLTGPALRRFGVAVTILFLPLALGAGSALILLFPAFWSVLLTSSFDQSLRFSIDKATFELLYMPLPAAVRGGVAELGYGQGGQLEERGVVDLFRHVIEIERREIEALPQHLADGGIAVWPELQAHHRLIASQANLFLDELPQTNFRIVVDLDLGVAGEADHGGGADGHATIELVEVPPDDVAQGDEELLTGRDVRGERNPLGETSGDLHAGVH
jgi:AAA family ATP:ADP antiporter